VIGVAIRNLVNNKTSEMCQQSQGGC